MRLFSFKIFCSIVLTFFSILCGIANGQRNNSCYVKGIWKDNIINYVRPIKSIESDNFSDISFLDTLLKDKQYVFIGESSHEVVEFYKMKTRLIKYLHEVLGFNVIAYEYDMGMASYFNIEKLSVTTKDKWKYLFYDICDESIEQQNYLVESKIKTTGFDVQLIELPIYYKTIRKVFPEISSDVIKRDSLFFLSTPSGLMKCGRKNKHEYFTMRLKQKDSLVNIWEKVLNDISPLSCKDTLNKIIYRSLIVRTFWIKTLPLITPIKRDSIMAENIMWLLQNVFTNDKIIFIAHNAHIQKVETNHYPWMVSKLSNSILKKSYVMGMYAYEGKTGVNHVPQQLTKNKKNSLGAIINSASYEYAFCDFSNQVETKENEWIFQKLETVSWATQRPKIVPFKTYDGIIQIKHVNNNNTFK